MTKIVMTIWYNYPGNYMKMPSNDRISVANQVHPQADNKEWTIILYYSAKLLKMELYRTL